MSISKFFRLSGVSIILGGVLWGLQAIGWDIFVGVQHPYPPSAPVFWLILLFANVFILLGLPALYLRMANRMGSLGFISFLTVFLGMALSAGIAWFGAFIQPGLQDLQMAAEAAGIAMQEPVMAGVGFLMSLGLYVIGWLFFSLISLRGRVLPQWALILTAVGSASWLIGEFTGFFIPIPLFAFGIAWMGYAMYRALEEDSETEDRTSKAPALLEQ